jgi:acetolactate decarboxylase
MMHEGQIGPMVELGSLMPDSTLFGLGAMADLAGEITILHGTAYLAYPEGTDTARIVANSRPDASATLLVVGHVPAWRSITLDHPVAFEKLEEEIPELAATVGLGREQRIPFLVTGTFDNFHWHVIDGSRLTDLSAPHQEHLKAAVKFARDRVEATLVGFYSERDRGVFTHMDSKLHVHCVVSEPLSAGHVDHVDVPAGATVEFPVVEE